MLPTWKSKIGGGGVEDQLALRLCCGSNLPPYGLGGVALPNPYIIPYGVRITGIAITGPGKVPPRPFNVSESIGVFRTQQHLRTGNFHHLSPFTFHASLPSLHTTHPT